MYRFVDLPNYKEIREPLLSEMLRLDVKGTLLIASEGINGTVSGTNESIASLLDWLRQVPGFEDIDHKLSFDDEQPFYRTKVKLKKEIVTMGVEGIDPKRVVGTYVKPKDWNALISDPDVVLIDTRNDYEYEIGTFDGAINPVTDTFREFPAYVEEHLDPGKNKKVAMFCTGGIRCEKSTAFLKEKGFDEVYHLEGGILKYLEDVPKEETMWQGDCFVFDNRVAVDHDLQKSAYDQCHACRLPITEQDMAHAHYVKGVSCPRCFGKHSEKQLKRFEERQKQIELAKRRGEDHIGSGAVDAIEVNRKKKQDAIKAQQESAKGA